MPAGSRAGKRSQRPAGPWQPALCDTLPAPTVSRKSRGLSLALRPHGPGPFHSLGGLTPPHTHTHTPPVPGLSGSQLDKAHDRRTALWSWACCPAHALPRALSGEPWVVNGSAPGQLRLVTPPFFGRKVWAAALQGLEPNGDGVRISMVGPLRLPSVFWDSCGAWGAGPQSGGAR